MKQKLNQSSKSICCLMVKTAGSLDARKRTGNIPNESKFTVKRISKIVTYEPKARSVRKSIRLMFRLLPSSILTDLLLRALAT